MKEQLQLSKLLRQVLFSVKGGESLRAPTTLPPLTADMAIAKELSKCLKKTKVARRDQTTTKHFTLT